MWKVLVTTTYYDSGTSQRALAVHTLVLEFDNDVHAKTAAKKINDQTTSHGLSQKAVVLF